MTYSTTPGTIAHRVVELLRGQPPGTQMTAGQIGEALDIDAANLRPCLLTPIRYGLLVATPNPADKRRMIYSLGEAEAPAAPDADPDDAAPLHPPIEGVPAAPSSVFALGAAAEVGAVFPALSAPAGEPKKRARKPKDRDTKLHAGPQDNSPAAIQGCGEADPHGMDPHEPGAKLDAGKVRAGLVLGGFARALLAVCEVGEYGATKYTPHGWQQVPDGIDRYTDAMHRHLLAEAAGQARDADTEMLHAAHAAWNALARLDLMIRRGD